MGVRTRAPLSVHADEAFPSGRRETPHGKTNPGDVVSGGRIAQASAPSQIRYGGADHLLWNGAVNRTPALIVRPHTSGKVAAAANTALSNHVPLSVRAGGHDWADNLDPQRWTNEWTNVEQNDGTYARIAQKWLGQP
jgi:hypothetical protein